MKEVKTIIERDYDALKRRGKVFKKSFKGSGKILKNAGTKIVKGCAGMGEAMSDFYGVNKGYGLQRRKRRWRI